jgi:hypothetical protein
MFFALGINYENTRDWQQPQVLLKDSCEGRYPKGHDTIPLRSIANVEVTSPMKYILVCPLHDFVSLSQFLVAVPKCACVMMYLRLVVAYLRYYVGNGIEWLMKLTESRISMAEIMTGDLKEREASGVNTWPQLPKKHWMPSGHSKGKHSLPQRGLNPSPSDSNYCCVTSLQQEYTC